VTGCGSDGGDTAAAPDSPPPPTSTAAPPERGALHGSLDRLNGEPDDLAKYQGKVVLVVNTASECGFAPQFGQLEALYTEKRGDGFVILGFPADDVAGQEPRDDAEIAEYCESNFGVTFPMFAKSNVVDDPVNPLYERLAAAQGEPTYNFNKYLLDRSGVPLRRWGPETEPDDPELVAAIDRAL
jgi:glutathione peroxidase